MCDRFCYSFPLPEGSPRSVRKKDAASGSSSLNFQVEQATRACVLLVFKFQRWCCRADSTSKFEELVGFFSAGFVGWIKLQLRLGEPDVRGPGVEAIIC